MRKRLANIIEWLIKKGDKSLPPNFIDWLTKKKRQLNGGRFQANTVAQLRSSLSNGKYIRWGCTICGSFMQEVKEWPKHHNFVDCKCRNGHYNQIKVYHFRVSENLIE